MDGVYFSRQNILFLSAIGFLYKHAQLEPSFVTKLFLKSVSNVAILQLKFFFKQASMKFNLKLKFLTCKPQKLNPKRSIARFYDIMNFLKDHFINPLTPDMLLVTSKCCITV